MQRDPFSTLPPPIAEILRADDASARKSATFGGPIVAAIGLGIAGLLFSYAADHGRASSPRAEELIPMLVGLAVCALGVRWFISRKSIDPRVTKLTGSDVIWLYVDERSSSSSGFSTKLRLGTRSGELIGIDVAGAKSPGATEMADIRRQADELLRAVAPFYPRAAVGFSAENEVAFQRAQQHGAQTHGQ